jgi:hypothetical protein
MHSTWNSARTRSSIKPQHLAVNLGPCRIKSYGHFPDLSPKLSPHWLWASLLWLRHFPSSEPCTAQQLHCPRHGQRRSCSGGSLTPKQIQTP